MAAVLRHCSTPICYKVYQIHFFSRQTQCIVPCLVVGQFLARKSLDYRPRSKTNRVVPCCRLWPATESSRNAAKHKIPSYVLCVNYHSLPVVLAVFGIRNGKATIVMHTPLPEDQSFARAAKNPAYHEKHVMASGGYNHPLSPYIYAWAFSNLAVRGDLQVPDSFFFSFFFAKTITKAGNTHKAHTSGHCTGGWIFTHTTIIYTTYIFGYTFDYPIQNGTYSLASLRNIAVHLIPSRCPRPNPVTTPPLHMQWDTQQTHSSPSSACYSLRTHGTSSGT